MVKTEDHALEAFENRKKPEAMYGYVARLQVEANQRMAARRKAQREAAAAKKKS